MSKSRTIIVAGSVSVLIIALVIWFLWKPTPPQMGDDEDVFNTVDALYTAVREHDTAGVDRCRERLVSYASAGKLTPNAEVYLNGVMAKADKGRWDSAAEDLHRFMSAQRRDGGTESTKIHKSKKKS